jgi:hypothetical protein
MTAGTISLIIGIVILFFLNILFKDKDSSGRNKGFQGIDNDDLLKEEPEFDRTWSFLPSNIFHRSDDD